MGFLGAAALAFLIASVITASELITTKYPRTGVFLRGTWALYVYCAIYGLIAFGATLGLDTLISAKAVKLEGIGLSSPWVRAIVVGLAAKAFLHINLFNVSVGSQAVPIGPETVVQIFEPYLLRSISLQEWYAVREYVTPRAARFRNDTDLALVKETIKNNIPAALPDKERAAFENDIDRATKILGAMEAFLRFLGRKIFNGVFPP